jgi:glycosyltransferase involved in cell wall biosynthesis
LGLIPALLSRLFNKKVLFTGGIDTLDKEYMKASIGYYVQKWFYKLCSLFSNANIIVSSTDLKNIKLISNNSSDIYLVPHVIDVSLYKYDNRAKVNTIVTIVWMGSIVNVKRKGVDKLLYIFDEFYKLNKNFELLIIGTKGDGTDYLLSILNKLDSKKQVRFLDAIDEEYKIDLLKGSKYYFQISEYEGFGIASIEALAAGNIVFHSGNGGLKDTIGQHGILIEDTLKYKDIAMKINSIDNEYINYKYIINDGIKYVENNFSYNVRKTGIQEILNSFT